MKYDWITYGFMQTVFNQLIFNTGLNKWKDRGYGAVFI